MRRELKADLVEGFVVWLVAGMLAIPFVVGLMGILVWLLGGSNG